MKNLSMIVPIQSSLAVSLPPSSATLVSHLPFPQDLPTIARFDDEVEMMNSLMRPRKITILDSAGKTHYFLCKPKDDLRKDTRLMEFNSMINKLLKKDPESRRRQLYLRTYAVIPVNEECGIIQWVNNTVAFRHALMKVYAAENIGVPAKEIKRLSLLPNKLDVFTNELVKRFVAFNPGIRQCFTSGSWKLLPSRLNGFDLAFHILLRLLYGLLWATSLASETDMVKIFC